MKIKVEIDTGELASRAAARLHAGAAALKSAGRTASRAMEWGLTAAFALIAIAMFVAYWFGAAFIVHEAMEEKDPASRWAMLLGGGVAFIMLTIVGIALLRRVYVSRKTIVERT